MILKLVCDSFWGVLRETEQTCLLSGSILAKPQATAKKSVCQPRVYTQHFSLLNLCPTSQITPNVICLGLVVFSQVACYIMHCNVRHASHEKYGVTSCLPTRSVFSITAFTWV